MTYKGLQDECLIRFDDSRRASIKSWLNLRYSALWALEDWHFKHVKGAALTVSASNNRPTMPSDFGKSEGLYDQTGTRLLYLEPADWRDNYLPTPIATGYPEAYTVIDRELWLGPTPSSTVSFTLSYLRRLSHVDGPSGLAAAGVMVNDSDQPIWEAEYDYLLVLDACILGCQLLEFPWSDLTPQRDELLAAMREDLIGGQVGEPAQWGAWS